MVFYGLAVALIVVNVWRNYSDVAKVLSQEATATAALYRDVSSYPEPSRSQLQKQLRDYVYQIIHQAWPMLQHGQIPSAGVEMMNDFQATLSSFEPMTEGQKILHTETLRAYDQLIQARRLPTRGPPSPASWRSVVHHYCRSTYQFKFLLLCASKTVGCRQFTLSWSLPLLAFLFF